MASLGREGASFRLLGNPVTIRWMFFVGALVIGASMRRDPASIVVWILVVAVAVLLHELGHALVARSLGFDPSIELHVIGGLTTWAWTRRPRWFERLGTSLAGPAIGFAAAAALWPLLPLLKSAGVPPLLRLAAGDFLWVTIVWGIFNLLPILPLDGGRIVASLLPTRMAWGYAKLEPFGFPILLGLMFLGALNVILAPMVAFSFRLLGTLFQI
jgi:stage IV sporulation protein FB